MSFALLLFVLSADASPSGEALYREKIKPLLATKCVSCHGSVKQEGGLRLDTAHGARLGGDSGPALVAHEASTSLLLERVRSSDADQRMPPADSGAPLRPEEIDLLSQWIDEGGIAPPDESPDRSPAEHWAFRPPARPSIPVAEHDGWTDGPIDAFIRERQRPLGIDPQRDADRSIWLRRVSLDLVGLPPDLDSILAFEADPRADAAERIVDVLLASPAHGERWGRHWMDIWRYSDWWGLGPDVRNSQKHIWHWRDWIVDSLNTNVGYDEMVRQMLAADELYPDDPDKLRATGFLVRHYFKFNRNTWMEETIEHTSKGFLGLTMNCARCHDHKYDPWTQEDYFQFRAFFEPYHVRTDQVPGELDYEKDGIPRAYDAHLDAPTYLFTQGDENRPVKERVLSPSLPVLLSSGVAVEPIQTIALPTESHQTGLRTWVVENHRRAARLKREASQQAYESARQQVDRWLRASHAGSRSILFEDDFGSLRDDRWLAASGHWEIVDREVRQIGTSSAHSSLASKTPLAGDFEWSGRLTIHGGQRWKSAGVAFDVTDQGRIGVYLSAFADGAKVQIYFRQNGVDQYSDAGSQARSVPLDRPSVLTIRVRGSLVHVLVDGAHALSYRVPMERTPGTWELFTYDAQASFDDVRVMSLPADMDLPEPGIAPQAVSLEDALLAREIAVAFGEAATKEEIALEARLQAMRLSSDDAARKRAGNAQWEASLADAEHQYLSARRSAGTAAGETARTLLETRLKRIDELRAQQHHPDKPFTPVPGSSKAPESNQESPASLAEPFPAQSSGRRSALARWMTHPQNATFGRVAVNHLWARHLGQALVKTVIDFGLKGASPTHPELLDYLTTEWTDRTFDMKALHRDIVTSHTYRLSSSTNGAHPPAMERDPNNETYWRHPDLRMEAEILRDSLLTLGHRLDRQMHGANIDPAQNPSSLRRSLYFTHSHNERDRFLEVFDSASTRECYVRSASIIPQQSLALANSRLALESSQEIAAALTAHEPDQTDARFIDLAWLWILSARPTPDERRLCEEAMTTWRQTNTAESARTQLVRSLINHNDFIAIR